MTDLFNPFATTPPPALRDVSPAHVRRMGDVEAPRFTKDGGLVLRVEGGPQDRALWISANDRRNRYLLGKLTKQWREAAKRAGEAANVRDLGWQRVHVVAYLHYIDMLRRDTTNGAPTVKACVDGLVDAGLVADDNWRYMDGPDLRLGEPTGASKPGKPQKAAVTFVIADLGTPLPRRTR